MNRIRKSWQLFSSAPNSNSPFALSLSKGEREGSIRRSCFDKLSTNGKAGWLALFSLLTFALALLSACAIQLAPLYDKAVADGLNAANTDAMALFAEASGGTTKESYSQREPKYDRAIGEYDALVAQAAARPVPSNDMTDAIGKIVGARNAPGDKNQVIPSTTAMKGLSDTLSKMKEVDRKQGVTAMEVMAFRGQALIYMDQALTYEAALKR